MVGEIQQTYIHKLMEIFRICEERGNTEGLRMMFKVVKGLISLNDGHIFDMIFSDEYLMDIVGALEYDSELSTHQHHRKYLREQVIFKEVKQTGNMLLPISTMCFLLSESLSHFQDSQRTHLSCFLSNTLALPLKEHLSYHKVS
jgi:hypothetical protein